MRSPDRRSAAVLWILTLASASAACSEADVTPEPTTGVVRSALPTPLVIEAEGASGAGIVELDRTASNGELIALTVPGPSSTATKSFTTTGPVVSGTVRVRGGACSPTIKVSLDGYEVLTTQVTQTAWTELPLALPFTLWSGDHTVAFNYRLGPPSCTLRIDQATFMVDDPPPPPDPPVSVVVEAEDAVGAGVVETDASASSGELRAFSEQYTGATTAFTTTGVITSGSVRVRGTQCAWTPWVRIRVDGFDTLLTAVPQTTWTELPLSVPALAAGSHTVEFYYRSGTTGCMLRVDHATFFTN